MSKITPTVEARPPKEGEEYVRIQRARQPEGAEVRVGEVALGGEEFVVIAGPCAVESREQIEQAGRDVVDAGARILRGGAFKPRTSPYSFQGLGMEGVELMRRASLRAGLPFVTEVMAAGDIEEMAPRVDAFQVGTRNMHNFELLRALGQTDKPVLLKRGFGATLREWLLAAEYIARGGNEAIILCERGVRGFDDTTRFTLDLAGAVWAKQETFLPVIVDPSHATGVPSLVGPMAAAALAAGLDGVMIEVHPKPQAALSDGEQALTLPQLEATIDALRPIAAAVGRRIGA